MLSNLTLKQEVTSLQQTIKQNQQPLANSALASLDETPDQPENPVLTETIAKQEVMIRELKTKLKEALSENLKVQPR